MQNRPVWLLLILLWLVQATASAVEFKFVYQDNSFRDFEARGWMQETSLFQRNIRAAGQLWGARIDSDVVITVMVEADRTALRAGGAPTTGRMLLQNTDGYVVWEPGPLSKIRTGVNPGALLANTPDIRTVFDPFFVDAYYAMDPSPETRLSDPSFSQTDFIWIVLHELGHGLGMAGWRVFNSNSVNYGQFRLGRNSVFDNLTRFDGNGAATATNGQPNNLFFLGSSAMEYFGGPVPIASLDRSLSLSSQNFYHLGSCSDDLILVLSLMNGCASHLGRFHITAIDLAILADIGYPTVSLQPQFRQQTGILHVPFAVIPGFGVLNIGLRLVDEKALMFELISTDPVPLGTEQPAIYDAATEVLHIPTVEVIDNEDRTLFEIAMVRVGTSEPIQFVIIAANPIDNEQSSS